MDYDTAFFQVQAPMTMKLSGATLSNTVGASGVRFDGQQDDNEYRVTGYNTDPGANGNTPVSVTSTAEPNPWMNKDYAIEGLGGTHAPVSAAHRGFRPTRIPCRTSKSA